MHQHPKKRGDVGTNQLNLGICSFLFTILTESGGKKVNFLSSSQPVLFFNLSKELLNLLKRSNTGIFHKGCHNEFICRAFIPPSPLCWNNVDYFSLSPWLAAKIQWQRLLQGLKLPLLSHLALKFPQEKFKKCSWWDFAVAVLPRNELRKGDFSKGGGAGAGNSSDPWKVIPKNSIFQECYYWKIFKLNN